MRAIDEGLTMRYCGSKVPQSSNEGRKSLSKDNPRVPMPSHGSSGVKTDEPN
jgi:hypothetical protein